MRVERFAPSPTGFLHLGHAYSACLGWSAARAAGGCFLLRMEDLDASRVRPEYYGAIETDLGWLGLDWDGPVLRQSERGAAYADAIARLEAIGLTYRCTCTRRDIQEALAAPQEGTPARAGPDGAVYPGTCRAAAHAPEAPAAIRLDMARALAHLGGAEAIADLTFTETGTGPSGETGPQRLSATALIDGVGDIVLGRRDGAIAYHLAVVVDDAHQGITHVTRGHDLFAATCIHRLLQALLALPVPVYRHHDLIRDAAGRRLAKRDDARSIARYREDGMSPADVRRLIGLSDHSA